MKNTFLPLTLLFALVFFLQPELGNASSIEHGIDEKTRCPVCGMFVVKYKLWWSQLTLSDGTVHTFDGVKDMMAYYFTPATYGAPAQTQITKVAVKDYYTQEWLDGEKALYVVGSDVLGPMGHELIPFINRPAAESFLKDHKGKEILTFDEITAKRITAMKKGHKMMKHTMKDNK